MLITALVFLYILSRIYFINAGGVFFDAPEYLHLFSLPNFFEALTLGHHPLHIGYILLFWPFYQMGSFLHLNGGYVVVLIQILVSIITLYCLYQFITYISDKKVALVTVILTALLPLYWIITDTIMMENAYISCFFISIYFLIRTKQGKSGYFNYSLSFLFFILALMTHTMVSLWLPFLIFLVYFKKRNLFLSYIIFSVLSVAIAYLLNFYLMLITSHINWLTLFHELAKEKDDMAVLSFNVKSLLIIFRDFFILQMRNYTSLLTLLALISLVKLYKPNRNLFILNLLWILPAVYINLWWDVLLPGRYALISGFGIAFLGALFIKKSKIITLLVICYLLIVTVPAMNLLKKPIPYLQEAAYAANLPKDSLLIESHFSRPQVQATYKGKLGAVNEYMWGNGGMEKEINLYLQNKRPVYISSQAISDPYGLYTGPYLHYLSLSYDHPFQLDPMLTQYSLKEYKVLSQADNLIIYQIISKHPSSYPKVMSMANSYRRIDYYDPLWWIYRFLITFLPKKP